jgi:adenylosuccinate synthase
MDLIKNYIEARMGGLVYHSIKYDPEELIHTNNRTNSRNNNRKRGYVQAFKDSISEFSKKFYSIADDDLGDSDEEVDNEIETDNNKVVDNEKYNTKNSYVEEMLTQKQTLECNQPHKHGKVDIVLDLHYGDNGKGAIIDHLLATGKYNISVRQTGSSNCGHVVYIDGEKYVFHMMPTGIIHEDVIAVIGTNCVIPLDELELELTGLFGANATFAKYAERLKISDRAQITLPIYKEIDRWIETSRGSGKIGSTLKGVGPAYTAKHARNGIRVCDLYYPDYLRECLNSMSELYERSYPGIDMNIEATMEYLAEFAEKIKNNIIDIGTYLNDALAHELNIIVEGSQGMSLDINNGNYPFVTSTECGVSSVLSGLSISHEHIRDVIGVIKTYATRVGSGPFVTELKDNNANGEKLQEIGKEFGSTSGRKRRCGWLDLYNIGYNAMISGVNVLNVNKLDVLDTFEEISVCVGYEDENGAELDRYPASFKELEECKPIYSILPGWRTNTTDIREFDKLPLNAQVLIDVIQDELRKYSPKLVVKYIKNGPDREQIIVM